MLDEPTLRRLRRNLGSWFAANARDLPWRRTSDPYRIWISEVMLQQTTVAAVLPYFERFLARFPTVHDLASAPEDDVLRHWEGLGYYSRARNIYKAAQQIVAEREGVFPAEVAELVRLPGIGRYTAGAIASFAFDRRAPIVEVNTQRVYARLLGHEGDPRTGAGQRVLWDFAERVLPQRRPGRFNQALMELGATLCAPQRPACPECPVRSCCRAFAQNLQNEIPRLKPRPQTTAVVEATVAVRADGRYLLRRRQPGERWAGLWDFPRFEVADQPVPAVGSTPAGRFRRELEQAVLAQTGVAVAAESLLSVLRHGVTRFRITLLCYVAEAQDAGTRPVDAELSWAAPGELERFPLSMTGRKFARLLVDADEA